MSGTTAENLVIKNTMNKKKWYEKSRKGNKIWKKTRKEKREWKESLHKSFWCKKET